MSKKKKTCFVVMPISTHDDHLSLYRDDGDHFEHVLEHLFKPAIEMIDYKPISPKAEGSDLIPAEIIKNIQTSDLVLCDMSTLNANVFFELGIRTAMNKPVCMVADDKTQKIPFDQGYINFQPYDSSIVPWVLEQEIEKLKNHLLLSIERSAGKNKLWEYFGIKSSAEEFDKETGEQAKFDFIINQLDRMRSDIHTDKYKSEKYFSRGELKEISNRFREKIKFLFPEKEVPNYSASYDPNGYVDIAFDRGEATTSVINQLFELAKELNVILTVTEKQLS